jgi:hypothetical protein
MAVNAGLRRVQTRSLAWRPIAGDMTL